MTERSISVSRTVAAPPEAVFDVLADPAMHPEIDGSGTVTGSRNGPQRLAHGSKFGMSMRIGVPYVISNTVTEFEEDRRIAWRHVGKWTWRYELEPVDGGRSTKVTETFDWGTSYAPKLLELLGYPERNRPGMEATLERLEQVVTSLS